jgi:hypothetical protein
MNEINRAIGARPTLEWVNVELVDVDNNYQRPLKQHLVDKILRKFEWKKFGAVCLVRKGDGRFNVIEGQHRCKAAQLHPDVDQVPACITDAVGTESDADSFLAINRDRMAVTSIEQFWAGITAGNAADIAVQKVLNAAGCDVVPEQGYYKPHLTNSVFAVRRCLERYGEAATRRALQVLRQAWPNDDKALNGSMIQALARIVRANEKAVTDLDLAAAIRPQTRKQLAGMADGLRKLAGGSQETVLAKAIVELHNKGRRVNIILIGAAA